MVLGLFYFVHAFYIVWRNDAEMIQSISHKINIILIRYSFATDSVFNKASLYLREIEDLVSNPNIGKINVNSRNSL